jgi:predicted aspartyl protease
MSAATGELPRATPRPRASRPRRAWCTGLLAGVLATAFAATAIAQPAAPAAATNRAEYPLTLARGSRILVAARIDGHPVTALLDSAAEATMIDRAFARRLGLGRGAAATGHGSGEAAFDADLVPGVSLEAVGLALANQTVAVVDLTDVGRRLLGRRIDVILGREIFDAARLTIDLGRRRIAVAPAGVTPPGVRLELVAEHGVETVPVRIEDGETVRATFDLGNGSHVLIGRAYAERAGLLTDGRPVASERGGGLGGEVARQTFVLRSLELAGRRFESVRAAIDAQDTASAVNLGVSLLRHFVITTDFAGRAVWLQPQPAGDHLR